MSYTCETCQKTFTKEKYLTNHTQRKVCAKTFVCRKCNVEFASAYSLRQHAKRKVPCVPDKIPVIDVDSNENKCMYCGKCYSTGYNLTRHMGTCTMKNNQEVMFKMMETLIHEFKEIKEENKLLKQQTQSQVINNTINIDNSKNLYVNVTICSFGNEDLSRLNQQGVIDLLKGQVEDFMPKMIEYIHANPKHPEFHNVFYDPIRKKVLVFKQNQNSQLTWQFEDIEHVSKLLADKIKEHIHPLNGPYFNTLSKDKDSETANKIPQILCTNWSTPEMIEGTKESLTKVTHNEGFMDQVSIME